TGAQSSARGRILTGALLASIASLGLGAVCVVLETTASDIAELPFRPFMLLMLPIHCAIAIVEGLATAAIVSFIGQAWPELFCSQGADFSPKLDLQLKKIPPPPKPFRPRRAVAALALAAVLIAGVFSCFASTRPDGLEWAIERVAGYNSPAMTTD